MWGHGEHKTHLAERVAVDARGRTAFGDGACNAQRQIGLATCERFERAGEHFVTQFQACRRIQSHESLAQLHDCGAVDDAVHRDGELTFPARGHASDAVGNRVHVSKQTLAFAQQFVPSGGEFGLA